jgi:hypothetical protein
VVAAAVVVVMMVAVMVVMATVLLWRTYSAQDRGTYASSVCKHLGESHIPEMSHTERHVRFAFAALLVRSFRSP